MAKENESGFNRGMVVVAHADDAEFGCSGTVAKLSNEGWEIVYVICTDGSKGSSKREMTQKDLSRIRRQEQKNAAKVLGLKDVVFLNYEDSVLQPTLELRRDITQEIRRHQPDIVICQHPMRTLEGLWGLGHPDHLAAGEATLSAIFPTARDHMTFPELLDNGFDSHKVAEVWIMGHPNPDHIVDVTNYISTSIRAILQHVSQIEGWTEEEAAKRMREWRRKKGIGKGIQYAEEFKRIVMGR